MASPLEALQSLGRALMLPIAVLPAAGLLLRLGQPDLLDIAFVAFIRPELKFDSIEALIRQMDDDSAKAKAALAVDPGAFPVLGQVG